MQNFSIDIYGFKFVYLGSMEATPSRTAQYIHPLEWHSTSIRLVARLA